MPGTVKKGKYSTKQSPCQVCENTTGSCKRNHDGSIYCYHSLPHSAPSGYVYIRELSDGMGQEFIEPQVADELLRTASFLQSQGKKASTREMADLTGLPSSWARAVQEAYPLQFPEWNDPTHPSYYRCRPREEKSQTLEEESTNSSNLQRRILNEQERDEQYRQIMEQLSLGAAHQSQLIRDRGLGEFLDFIGFRSWQEVKVKNVSSDLPGVVEREGSFYLYGQPGLFLPICNELGQIIGFQLRPDDTSTGKYKWGSSAPASGNGPRLDNGEIPLTFCRPPSVELPSIGLAEGVLKAWSAACFLRQIVIGAPGAAWDSTPKLLKRYLDKVAAERDVPICSLVVDLYVDAGMLSNQQIMRRYYETLKLLQQWGCKTRIGWWDQTTKESGDVDDLIRAGGRYQLTYISVDEWMTLWPPLIRDQLLHSDNRFDTSDWMAPVQHPHRSELGYWIKPKKGSNELQPEFKWIPLTNFSFKVERELLGINDGFGGVMVQVKRTYDSYSEQDRVVVPAEAFHKVTDFINTLSRATGKVYLTNKFKSEQLQKYLHKELAAYRERGGKPYKLCDRIGRQSDGAWVFPNCQISSDGHFITESESNWVFNKAAIAKEKIPIPKICTEPEPEVLTHLVDSMRNFFGQSGFMPAFFTMSFVVAGLFYDEILEEEGSFPVLGLYGDAGTGKTVAGVTALSLLGLDHRAKLQKTSESAYHERFKLMGGIAQFLDDPDKAQIDWVIQQVKTQYGGASRVVRENSQDPHSPLMVGSNFSIGDDDPIILSRLIRLAFEGTPNPMAYRELHEYSRIASCVLPQLIQLGYPQQEVKNLQSELIGLLPAAHSRLASSLALVGFYAFRLAELSGAVSKEEVWAYLKGLCGDANQDESKKSSLDDFIDRLLVLRSQTEVGEWNCRLITEDGSSENRNYKSLAVYLHGVWPTMSRYFKNNLPYSQKIIRQQIEKAGGKTCSKQKFHCDKDSSVTYQRLKVNLRTDADGNSLLPTPPETVTRSCVEIPIQLLLDRLNGFELPDAANSPPSSPPPDSSGGAGNSLSSLVTLSVTEVSSHSSAQLPEKW